MVICLFRTQVSAIFRPSQCFFARLYPFFHRATVRDYIQDLSLSMHEKKNEEEKRNWHDSLGNDGVTLAMDNPIIIQWYKKC